MDNLKVDLKTSILELKRKHNKLVDNVFGSKIYKHSLAITAEFTAGETVMKALNISFISKHKEKYTFDYGIDNIISEIIMLTGEGMLVRKTPPIPQSEYILYIHSSGGNSFTLKYLSLSDGSFESITGISGTDVSDTVTEI